MKEKELEDKLEKNLGKIEPGLSLIERQKRVDTGIIDLFCKDKNGNYVIIEIKRKPSTHVIAQLAKYNMALIKEGLNKKRLRTILVAQESSKAIEEACEFFNFEIKNVYKEKISNKKEESDKKKKIPKEEELIMFIKNREFVNISTIAKFFNIYHATASDFVEYLKDKKLIDVKKIGVNKIVSLKK